jgi:DNA-binding response OmpR family regulator
MRQRVLVVDDDPLIADTLRLIFKAHGFQAEACCSAAEGMARARSFAPQLLVCDVTMPDETGLQLAEKMQQELPECKVLMLSAYSSNAIKVELQAKRMKRALKLLSKPCRPELLLEEAEALLRAG